jgi:hypothetical protein
VLEFSANKQVADEKYVSQSQLVFDEGTVHGYPPFAGVKEPNYELVEPCGVVNELHIRSGLHGVQC